jgi:uracil-DNA glycosylase
MDDLLSEISRCRICAPFFDYDPHPVLQVGSESKIAIVGQAPGRRVHETGIPWDDPSGKRLRTWLGVSNERFYDPANFALIPMAFCYPGKGKSGDLPPRPECTPKWHNLILRQLDQLKLTILCGQYAMKCYLQPNYPGNITTAIKSFNKYLPKFLPIPHPSPRNIAWFQRNPWFEKAVLPELRTRVTKILNQSI